MLLRGVLSDDERTRLATVLEEGVEASVPTWEEWGTSQEAIANVHKAMRLYDTQRDPG